MNNFIPGKQVRAFKAREGKEAIIRYPCWEDLDALTIYSNQLSKEDTYIITSGEQISREQQAEYLSTAFKNMEIQDYIYLCCFIDGKLVGGCGIERNLKAASRKKHIGIFAITVSQETRGQGIGYELAKTTIEEAKKKLPGLSLSSVLCK